MTLGEIALLAKKQCPLADLELIEGWLEQRYRQVLDSIPWQRRETSMTVGLAAEYSVGTVALLNGSTSLTLTDGTFTPDMDGRAIRFQGATVYNFLYVGPATGQLDRAYEGISELATKFQMNVYRVQLPLNARLITSVQTGDGQELESQSRSKFRRSRLLDTGIPRAFTWGLDAVATQPMLEVNPMPVVATTLSVELITEGDLDAEAKNSALETWLPHGLLLAGVIADAKANERDYTGYGVFEDRFQMLLTQQVSKSVERMGPVALTGEVKRERVQRWLR